MVRSKRPIDLSQFDESVREVVAFALSDRPVELLLNPNANPDSERYHIVSTLVEVSAFGYSDASTPRNYEEYGGSHWGDVLSDELSPIYGERWDPAQGDRPSLKVSILLGDRWKSLSELLCRVDLDPEIGLDAGDLCDSTVSHLDAIASWRASFEKDSQFFDDMWNAFQTGGWPFGWFGEYPEGKMVVWKPKL